MRLLITSMSKPQPAAHRLYASGTIGPKNGTAAYAATGNANSPTANRSIKRVWRERIPVSYRGQQCVAWLFPFRLIWYRCHTGPISVACTDMHPRSEDAEMSADVHFRISSLRVHRIVVVHRSPKPTVQVRFLVGPHKRSRSLRAAFALRAQARGLLHVRPGIGAPEYVFFSRRKL